MFLLGIIFSFEPLVDIGIIMFAFVVLFQLVTLPVEFNASRRAMLTLSSEELRLIIEETEPYFGGCTVAFYLTGTEDEGKAALLAVTDLNEFNVSDDRYKISWAAENTLTVGFEDGANYRQLTIPIDRSHIEE